MRFTKSLATALAVTVGATAFASTAEAERRHYRHQRHHGGGDAVAAGILGFGAGAILGGALAQPRYYGGYGGGYGYNGYGYDRYYDAPVYVEPAPVYVEPRRVYVQPAPVYSYAAEAWTPEWYEYCENRYRSFDSQTGYFMGYDGRRHFCN